MENINLGGLESPKDERDFLGSGQVNVSHPSVFLPDYSNLPTYNQLLGIGGKTACGGAGGAKVQNILLGLGKDLSWRFVYAMCKKLDGLPADAGTYGRTVMQVLQKYGVPKSELFPNDVSLPIKEFADWTKIPQVALEDALSRRIGPYAQWTDISLEGLKQAVYQHKAVFVLKSPWIPASWTTQSSGTGHFNVLDGFREIALRFANCFGIGWGADVNGGGNGEGFYLESDVSTIKEAWIAYEPAGVDPIIVGQVNTLTKIVTLLTQAVQAYLKGRQYANK